MRRRGSGRAKIRVWSAPTGPLRKVDVVRRVSQAEAMELVNARKAEWAHGANGQNVGIQMCREQIPVKVFVVGDSTPSSAAMSRREMDLVAGSNFKEGGSRTVGMPEHRREDRVRRGLKETDAVEAASIKLAMFTANYSAGACSAWPR